MNHWLVLSATFNIILVMAVWAGWRSINGLIKTNVRLDNELQRYKTRVSQAEMVAKIYQITAKPEAPAQFDKKTTSLLRLAVGNANENESKAAALEACKRIHKKING